MYRECVFQVKVVIVYNSDGVIKIKAPDSQLNKPENHFSLAFVRIGI